MTEKDTALIAEARAWGAEKLPPGMWGANHIVYRLADRLAALTAPQEQEWEHGVIGGDDLLHRLMDTLAYYHCRSVNPKADSPYLGYHAMSEDQREFLRERQREAAEEVLRMWKSEARQCREPHPFKNVTCVLPQGHAPGHMCAPPAPQEGDVRERLRKVVARGAFEGFANYPLDGEIALFERITDAILAAFPALSRDIAGEIDAEREDTDPDALGADAYINGLIRAAEIVRNGR